MSTYRKTPFVGILVMVLAAVLIFAALERHLAGAWFAFGIHPDVLTALETSLDDQKDLARLDPLAASEYRERFGGMQTLLQRLRILEHNRAELVKRYQNLLLLAFVGTVALVTAWQVARQRRQERRLERLQSALADLASGGTDIRVGERRGDTIGRIAAMVERTSRVMTRDRRRLKTLENLSAWQEAARRHAHEMRTPLTGARLEISRLDGLLEQESREQDDTIRQAARSAQQEIERLGRFAQEFTSFARLPRPSLIPGNLGTLLKEFTATYELAWSNVRLEFEMPEETGQFISKVDRDLLRQVLVNLCDNSALALGDKEGIVCLRLRREEKRIVLDVGDNGPGVEEGVQGRLFEPYTTTRGIGEGMGLGLAISKKILLDHGGDLELHSTSAVGTTFRLTFPCLVEEVAAEPAFQGVPLHNLRGAEA